MHSLTRHADGHTVLAVHGAVHSRNLRMLACTMGRAFSGAELVLDLTDARPPDMEAVQAIVGLAETLGLNDGRLVIAVRPGDDFSVARQELTRRIPSVPLRSPDEGVGPRPA